MQRQDALGAADEIDLGPLLRAVLRYWYLVLALAAVGAGAGWGGSFFQRPVYRATVLLAPVHQDEGSGHLGALSSMLGDVGSLVGLGTGAKTDESQEAMATLTARVLTEAYIRQNRLIPVIYQDYWDPERQRYVIPWWKFWVDDPSLQTAAERFDKKIRHVVENKKTGMVELSVDWRDPVLAAKWANDTAQVTNSYLRQREIDRGNRALAYLNAQLQRTSVVELRQALFRLTEQQLKRIMTAQGNEEFSFRVVDPAVVPEQKYRPQRLVWLAIGAGAGALLAILVAAFLPPRRPPQAAGTDLAALQT